MKRLSLMLGIIISLSVILGAVYRFDSCKVSQAAFKEYVALNDTMWLENYRRDLQQRIWAIQKEFPNTYQQRDEYRRLVEELRLLEIKIKAYYESKGKGKGK